MSENTFPDTDEVCLRVCPRARLQTPSPEGLWRAMATQLLICSCQDVSFTLLQHQHGLLKTAEREVHAAEKKLRRRLTGRSATRGVPSPERERERRRTEGPAQSTEGERERERKDRAQPAAISLVFPTHTSQGPLPFPKGQQAVSSSAGGAASKDLARACKRGIGRAKSLLAVPRAAARAIGRTRE